MNKKTILISVLAIALIAIGLIIFMPSASDTFSEDSQLTSNGSISNTSDVLQSEALFLNQIQQLQRIDLSRADLLQDMRFTRLVDNTVELREIKAGRDNPYAPIDARAVVQRENSSVEAQEEVSFPDTIDSNNNLE